MNRRSTGYKNYSNCVLHPPQAAVRYQIQFALDTFWTSHETLSGIGIVCAEWFWNDAIYEWLYMI